MNARHAAERVTRAAPIGILTGIGAAVTNIVSPTLADVVGGLGGVAGALVLAPYSRGQEREADAVGQQLAAKAGWDPAGLSASLRALGRDEALHHGEKRTGSFFATHPPLPDRVAETEARAATLPRAAAVPVAANRADFLRNGGEQTLQDPARIRRPPSAREAECRSAHRHRDNPPHCASPGSRRQYENRLARRLLARVRKGRISERCPVSSAANRATG